MLKVTKLDGRQLHINPANIQWIEELPDTTITFLGGAKLTVKEPLSQLLNLIQSPQLASESPWAESSAAPQPHG